MFGLGMRGRDRGFRGPRVGRGMFGLGMRGRDRGLGAGRLGGDDHIDRRMNGLGRHSL